MSQEPLQTLGAKIRALRMAKGLTQGQLAQGEITPGLISQIESDRVGPSVRVAMMLARQLGVPEDTLLVDVETRAAQNQQLRDARERLNAGDGVQAQALLHDLQQKEILYLSPLEIRLELAYARELQGYVEEAEAIYAEVEIEAFFTYDHLLGANCMNRQGDYYDRCGHVSRAFYCYRQAVKYLIQLNNPPIPLLIYSHRNLAICAYRIGDSAVALTFAEEAYGLLEHTAQHQDFAELCHFMSVLLMDVGQKDRARQYASQAVRLYRVLGRSEALTDAQMNEVIVQRSLGDYKGALKAIPALITDYYEQGRHSRLTNAWTERAVCETTRGLHEDAARSLERSFSLATPNTPEYGEALRVRAQMQASAGKSERAAQTYEEAVDIMLRFDMFAQSREVLQTLMDIYKAEGNQDGLRRCERKLIILDTARQQQLQTLAITVAAKL